jgi:hypothetical protein
MSASNVRLSPSRRMTKAQAFSPNTGSGMATRQADLTAGWRWMKFSTSSQLIFSPPRLIRSLRRPSAWMLRPHLRTMSPMR